MARIVERYLNELRDEAGVVHPIRYERLEHEREVEETALGEVGVEQPRDLLRSDSNHGEISRDGEQMKHGV